MKKSIRYLNNKFILTDDNWKKFRIDSFCDTEVYTIEKNQDKVYIVKLIHELGKEKASIIKSSLDKIRDIMRELDIYSGENDGYGLAFEVFAIATIHSLDFKTVINDCIVSGSDDGKVDAIYYDTDNVYIYQIKINNLRQEDYSQMKKNIEEYIDTKKINKNNCADLVKFLERTDFSKHVGDGKDIKYCSVSSSLISNSNKKPIDIYKKYLETLIVPQELEGVSLKFKLPSIVDQNNNRIPKYASIGGDQFFLYYVASELVELLRSTPWLENGKRIHKLFYDNVRGELPKNKKMDYTIGNEPEMFSMYNNGISITGHITKNDYYIIVNNPSVVNGQQTLTNIFNYQGELGNVYLPIFLKNVVDKKIKSKVATYNNSQIKIKPIDLLSTLNSVREIQKKLMGNIVKSNILDPQNASYFLDIYTSGKFEYRNVVKRIFAKENIIKISEFVKLYFTCHEPKDLAGWKNTITKMIENQLDIIDKNPDFEFDIKLSKSVCHALRLYKQKLDSIDNKHEKNNLQSANLAFQYLLVRLDYDIERSYDIIKKINNKYFINCPKENKPSKLIDIYKQKDIYKKIELEISDELEAA